MGQRKGLAIASLVLGIISLPTLGVLGLGALAGVVLGIVALVKASREPQVYGGKGMAIAGIATSVLSILMLPFIGIIAAIAIPSLLRARVSANESAALGDVRTVISAEAAYQSANGGFYDKPECLGTPSRCIPGYAANAPTFLDGALASLTVKSGYSRTFYPGPAPGAEEIASAKASPSSLRSWAYVVAPLQPGRTGVRAFCGDASGRVCFTWNGSAPDVVNGACTPACQDLR